VGEQLQGRSGGAVSLAVGISKIFSGIPGFSKLISFWYHFAIMFEALFILTTIDTGTRIARFMVQELGGRLHPKFGRQDWMPARCSRRWSSSSAGPTSSGPGRSTRSGLCRHRQPASGGDRPERGHVGDVQWRPGPLRLSHPPSDGLRDDHDADGRLAAGLRSLPAGFEKMPESRFKWGLNIFLTTVMVACLGIIVVDSIRRWMNPLRPNASEPQRV